MSISAQLLSAEPVPALLQLARQGVFPEIRSGAVRVSRAPGRLDVMGGIAAYTGSLVCELPLDCAIAALLQKRGDRDVVVLSDGAGGAENSRGFRISLEALIAHSADSLRVQLAESNQKWAAYVVGCLFVLHDRRFIDLADPRHTGMTLAIHGTVPQGAGVSSSAALEVATMMLLRDHFDLMNPASGRMLRIAGAAAGSQRQVFGPMTLAALCQEVENRIVGAPCGIMDQASSCLGEQGKLLRMVCQPHDLQEPLAVPGGMRFIGINSNVRHDAGGSAYRRMRCAAFMGHAIIHHKMRRIGQDAGLRMVGDPMRGYLANLDPDDYKRIFRPIVPQSIRGDQFLEQFGSTLDSATTVDPNVAYAVQHATDHHVLEARRVRNFSQYLEQAHSAPGPREKGSALDRAGHLMYASHQSYGMDAMLGAPECDLLVQMVRARERKGLYGARISGGGSGGTVAVLAETTVAADSAIAEILDQYEEQTGRTPQVFAASSAGAWHLGTQCVELDVGRPSPAPSPM